MRLLQRMRSWLSRLNGRAKVLALIISCATVLIPSILTDLTRKVAVDFLYGLIRKDNPNQSVSKDSILTGSLPNKRAAVDGNWDRALEKYQRCLEQRGMRVELAAARASEAQNALSKCLEAHGSSLRRLFDLGNATTRCATERHVAAGLEAARKSESTTRCRKPRRAAN